MGASTLNGAQIALSETQIALNGAETGGLT